jgi:hypothetical protein
MHSIVYALAQCCVFKVMLSVVVPNVVIVSVAAPLVLVIFRTSCVSSYPIRPFDIEVSKLDMLMKLEA